MKARASDARRASGTALGPLDGIPYIAKRQLHGERADGRQWLARLRRPRRAAGRVHGRAPTGCRGDLPGSHEHAAHGERGMQRGLYGRAESPYNPAYLPAPFGSGSSNGSGVGPRGELRSVRPRRRDLVERPRPRLEQRAVLLHPELGRSSPCAATGRSCRPWMSSCRTHARMAELLLVLDAVCRRRHSGSWRLLAGAAVGEHPARLAAAPRLVPRPRRPECAQRHAARGAADVCGRHDRRRPDRDPAVGHRAVAEGARRPRGGRRNGRRRSTCQS